MAIQAGAFILAADHAIVEQSYTPVLLASTTNPTLGTGSAIAGRYWLDPITGRVWGHLWVKFGTSGVTAGNGVYRITLPVPAYGWQSGSTGQADIWGIWSALDNSASSASRHGLLTRDTVDGGPNGEALANLALYDGSNPFVTHAVPWTWAASDAITAFFDYMADL